MASGCQPLCADSVYNVVPAPISKFRGSWFSHKTTQHPQIIRPPRAALLNCFTGAKILGSICVYETLKLIQHILNWRFKIYNSMSDVWAKYNTERWSRDLRFSASCQKWFKIMCNLRHWDLKSMFDREGLICSTLLMKIMQTWFFALDRYQISNTMTE